MSWFTRRRGEEKGDAEGKGERGFAQRRGGAERAEKKKGLEAASPRPLFFSAPLRETEKNAQPRVKPGAAVVFVVCGVWVGRLGALYRQSQDRDGRNLLASEHEIAGQTWRCPKAKTGAGGGTAAGLK